MHQIAQICAHMFKNFLGVTPWTPISEERPLLIPSPLARIHRPTFSELLWPLAAPTVAQSTKLARKHNTTDQKYNYQTVNMAVQGL